MENLRKRVALGITINIGNYESLRVDVMAEADKLPDEDEKDLTNRLAEMVARDLMDLVSESKASIEEIKGG